MQVTPCTLEAATSHRANLLACFDNLFRLDDYPSQVLVKRCVGFAVAKYDIPALLAFGDTPHDGLPTGNDGGVRGRKIAGCSALRVRWILGSAIVRRLAPKRHMNTAMLAFAWRRLRAEPVANDRMIRNPVGEFDRSDRPNPSRGNWFFFERRG